MYSKNRIGAVILNLSSNYVFFHLNVQCLPKKTVKFCSQKNDLLLCRNMIIGLAAVLASLALKALFISFSQKQICKYWQLVYIFTGFL